MMGSLPVTDLIEVPINGIFVCQLDALNCNRQLFFSRLDDRPLLCLSVGTTPAGDAKAPLLDRRGCRRCLLRLGGFCCFSWLSCFGCTFYCLLSCCLGTCRCSKRNKCGGSNNEERRSSFPIHAMDLIPIGRTLALALFCWSSKAEFSAVAEYRSLWKEPLPYGRLNQLSARSPWMAKLIAEGLFGGNGHCKTVVDL